MGMVKGDIWHGVVAAREREGTTYIVYAIDIGISLHRGAAKLWGRRSGMMSYLDLHQGLHQRVCRRHGGRNKYTYMFILYCFASLRQLEP